MLYILLFCTFAFFSTAQCSNSMTLKVGKIPKKLLSYVPEFVSSTLYKHDKFMYQSILNATSSFSTDSIDVNL
jgi:hypothetical protein